MTAHDEWAALARFTPARVALGRAGNGLPTERVLEFQLAHARARDAVHTPFEAERVAREIGGDCRIVLTEASDRMSYLANPDLGRRLSKASRAALSKGQFDAALVIADGLSATAVHAHAPGLVQAIRVALRDLGWAPATVVRNGRVAIGDDVASALGAEMVAVIIGERPGLTSADSLGIYLTFRPEPGVTKDAGRNCISNVRPDGLALADAAHRLAWLMREARRLRLSGVELKEDAPENLLGSA